jgi:hypothetical protein
MTNAACADGADRPMSIAAADKASLFFIASFLTATPQPVGCESDLHVTRPRGYVQQKACAERMRRAHVGCRKSLRAGSFLHCLSWPAVRVLQSSLAGLIKFSKSRPNCAMGKTTHALGRWLGVRVVGRSFAAAAVEAFC